MNEMATSARQRKIDVRAACDKIRKRDDVPPATQDDARARRDALVAEVLQLEQQLRRGPSDARAAWLTDEVRQRREQIADMNALIKAAPSHDPAVVSFVARPQSEPPPYTVEVVEVCPCGEEIKPERAMAAWVYYCQQCGRDWSEPAPSLRPPRPRPPERVRRCECRRMCATCKRPKY